MMLVDGLGRRRFGALAIAVAWLLQAALPQRCSGEVHLTVGSPVQGGQYSTVQAAVDAVPENSDERYVIDIMPGTYEARVKVPSNKPRITLRGEDPSTTILTFNETANTPPNESTVHASTVVQGRDFIAENLTFENSFGPGVQALAIYAKADRLVFNNCRFLGWQDTLRSEFGRHYFYQVYVEGSVDFIYGRGTAYFEESTLFAKSNGYVTAQAREAANETNGYVFKDSTITGTADPGSVYLGRPWQAYSRTVFVDTKMGPVVNAAGWSTWSGNNNHETANYAEYNSMDLDGNPLDVSQRVTWSHQLNAEEVDEFSRANWLGGNDGWDPYSIVMPPKTAGDYNDDGVVNTADFAIWRDNLGATGTLANETVSPGIVDGADYNEWKAHYASSSGNGVLPVAIAPVPEPGALSLAIGAVCFTGLRMAANKEQNKGKLQ